MIQLNPKFVEATTVSTPCYYLEDKQGAIDDITPKRRLNPNFAEALQQPAMPALDIGEITRATEGLQPGDSVNRQRYQRPQQARGFQIPPGIPPD